MKRRQLGALLAALALAGCASPDRRIEAAKVSVMNLDPTPIRSLRVVLAPVQDLQFQTAWRESAAGWNTRLFDERFGPRLAATLEANGVRTQFRGASGLEVGAAGDAPPDFTMMVQVVRYSFATRNGVQDAAANYVIRVAVYRRGTAAPLLVYEDTMNRAFIASHDDIPDRFAYSFFNLLKDNGRWPAGHKIVTG